MLFLLFLLVIFLMVFVHYRKGTTTGLIVSCLFIYSCASMLQNKGSVYYDSSICYFQEENKERWKSSDDGFRNWNDGRSFSFSNVFGFEQYKINDNKGGEKRMEDLNSVVASVGSAITAIYVLIKTVIGFIAKLKRKN